MTTVNRIVSIGSNDKHLKSDNPEDFIEDEVLDNEDQEEDTSEEENQEEANADEGENKDQLNADKGEDNEDILPRFKGKTAAEISRAYAELEALNGRLSNEVGDYRKMAREYLFGDDSKASKDKNVSKRVLTDEDFLEKPSEAVDSVVSDKINPVLERLEKVDTSLRIAEFQRKNPDYMDIAADPGFHEWVKASPYRTKQYQRADAMDFEAADELMSGYREIKQLTSKNESNSKNIRQKNLRKVSSEKSSSAGSSGKKKIWSSAYLINLKITNPDKYNALQPEIMEAYKEGRVK